LAEIGWFQFILRAFGNTVTKTFGFPGVPDMIARLKKKKMISKYCKISNIIVLLYDLNDYI
jgi:hypothetical protein